VDDGVPPVVVAVLGGDGRPPVDTVVVVGAEDVDDRTDSAILVSNVAAVTVEWHEASAAAAAAAGRVGGGGGGEYDRWTSQRVITGASVLRRRGGPPGRKALRAVPLQWRVACPRRPRNRSASTRRSKNSCGVTKETPGESSSSYCSVSTVHHSALESRVGLGTR